MVTRNQTKKGNGDGVGPPNSPQHKKRKPPEKTPRYQHAKKTSPPASPSKNTRSKTDAGMGTPESSLIGTPQTINTNPESTGDGGEAVLPDKTPPGATLNTLVTLHLSHLQNHRITMKAVKTAMPLRNLPSTNPPRGTFFANHIHPIMTVLLLKSCFHLLQTKQYRRLGRRQARLLGRSFMIHTLTSRSTCLGQNKTRCLLLSIRGPMPGS
jgi:hypothetical protein